MALSTTAKYVTPALPGTGRQDGVRAGAHSLAPYARTGVPRAQVPWSVARAHPERSAVEGKPEAISLFQGGDCFMPRSDILRILPKSWLKQFSRTVFWDSTALRLSYNCITVDALGELGIILSAWHSRTSRSNTPL
jgi:hypothetical protein